MTPEQIVALSGAFSVYLEIYASCFARRESFQHFKVFCRGLLSDLPRKSVEPIALAAGVFARTLQQFLCSHVWNHMLMLELFQRYLVQLAALHVENDLGTIGVIDETSVVKKGDDTPGVQRQYCGAVGKIENCIVTVHLGIVRGLFKTLIDATLFLPRAWSDDRQRCRDAKIPDDVVYRAKWRIAIEQLDRACHNGVIMKWLTFDEYYGGKPLFLANLDQRPGMHYIGEIPRNSRCLTQRPRGGNPLRRLRGKRVDNLARFSPTFHQTDWRTVSLARLTLANQEWEVRSGQVYLIRHGIVTDRTYWLIVARNLATNEVKYFLSNAPATESIERLLRVAFCRWNVEHAFRVVKTEIGFGHFEGRSYVGLARHMILCLIVMGFTAEHTDRLRGEKSGDHDGASVPGNEPTMPSLAPEPARHDGARKRRPQDYVSPAAEPSSQTVATTQATCADLAL